MLFNFAWNGDQFVLFYTQIAGESFKNLVDTYLRKELRKGVPPLFVVLRPLYSDPEKVKIIEELVTGYEQNLREVGCFDRGKVKVV